VEEAEARARQILDEMEHELRQLRQQYKDLENQRDNLVTELRNLANDTLLRLQKISELKVKKVAGTEAEPKEPPAKPMQSTQQVMQSTQQVTGEPADVSQPAPDRTGQNDAEDVSFFDQIK